MQICYFQFLAEISSLLAVMRCSAVTSKHVILYSGFPFPVVEISQCYIYIQYRPLPLGLGLFACSIWGGGVAGLTMSGIGLACTGPGFCNSYCVRVCGFSRNIHPGT